MHVLILSQWYPPEPDLRIHALARELTARGHKVTAITGFPNYPSGKIYPGYRQRLWQWEKRDDVRILRLTLYPSHDRSALRRIVNYASFAVSASCFGPFLCGQADIIWVYHPPLTIGIPACWLSLIKHIPFVYEIQDMWPETIAATGMMSNAVVLHMLGAMARCIYKKAKAITVISPGFKRNLISKGVPENKIHVIPNWADEEIYRPVPADAALAEEYGFTGRFNIVFGGNLGAAQAMQNVLAVAALLRDLADVQFVLIGDGVDEQALRQRAAEQGLKNVHFIGRQPAERMPHFFALADALLIHLKNDPLFAITIPGKTMAYLASGRPIICAVAGDTADIVQNTGAGLICPPEDPQALAQCVRDLHAMPAEQRAVMGESGRRAFLQSYTRAVLIDRYERLFKSIIKSD
jgi:glycosyltransferase involved in cell wall biosynthesis